MSGAAISSISRTGHDIGTADAVAVFAHSVVPTDALADALCQYVEMARLVERIPRSRALV